MRAIFANTPSIDRMQSTYTRLIPRTFKLTSAKIGKLSAYSPFSITLKMKASAKSDLHVIVLTIQSIKIYIA